MKTSLQELNQYQSYLAEYEKWGKEYLKTYIYSLSHDEVKFLYDAVLSGVCLNLERDSFVKYLLRYRLYFNNDSTPNKKEIRTLLHTFEDAKSRRVAVSRQTLTALYPFLPKDWKKIFITKFIVRKKVDRLIAYQWLVQDWDNSFTRLLLDVWCEHGDEECAHLMLRVIPIKRLQPYRETLKQVLSYYTYCKYFGVANGEKIDRAKLSDIGYLYLASANNLEISPMEAEAILYKIAEKNLTDNPDKVNRALFCIGKLGFMGIVRQFYHLQHKAEVIEGKKTIKKDEVDIELQEETLGKMMQKNPYLATMIEDMDLKLS